ncbi:transposase [Patescibacteria group bacterium]|nr:transposase [Patescibacteria group bacterium]
MKHDRKKLRLNHYNYSNNGYYFITICTNNKQKYFGEIKNDLMILNNYGKIANKYWNEIPKHFNNIQLHEYIIMPNHIHGIIEIFDQNNIYNNEYKNNKIYLLSQIIKSYKEICSKIIHKQYNDYNFMWQKSYYDVIIRNETKFEIIRKYIIENPLKWNDDKYYFNCD